MQTYTLKIYEKIEKEFLESYATTVETKLRTYEGTRYLVTSVNNPSNVGMVLFNKDDQGVVTVRCTCKHYEGVGWLCLHAIRILLQHDVLTIPDQYILPRWTRTVKVHIWDAFRVKKSPGSANNELPAWRHHMSRAF